MARAKGKWSAERKEQWMRARWGKSKYVDPCQDHQEGAKNNQKQAETIGNDSSSPTGQ